MEVVGVTQMFSSYTKIADTLQLEPDMGDIAPVDSTARAWRAHALMPARETALRSAGSSFAYIVKETVASPRGPRGSPPRLLRPPSMRSASKKRV